MQSKMTVKLLRFCTVLLAVSCGDLVADSCIVSGSTNRTFAAQVCSDAWVQFDTGPNTMAVSLVWNELDSRLYTFDVTSGRNLLRERTCFVLSIR